MRACAVALGSERNVVDGDAAGGRVPSMAGAMVLLAHATMIAGNATNVLSNRRRSEPQQVIATMLHEVDHAPH